MVKYGKKTTISKNLTDQLPIRNTFCQLPTIIIKI